MGDCWGGGGNCTASEKQTQVKSLHRKEICTNCVPSAASWLRTGAKHSGMRRTGGRHRQRQMRGRKRQKNKSLSQRSGCLDEAISPGWLWGACTLTWRGRCAAACNSRSLKWWRVFLLFLLLSETKAQTSCRQPASLKPPEKHRRFSPCVPFRVQRKCSGLFGCSVEPH